MPAMEDGYSRTKRGGGGGAAAVDIGIREIEGRGRALVALKPLIAGQIVLMDSPIVLYSALPFTAPPQDSLYCYNCFRVLQPSSASTVVWCSSCSGAALFCSPNCRSIALATFHNPWACQALSRFRDYPWQQQLHLHQDLQLQARFLVSAYSLCLISPPTFRTLLSLQGSASQPDEASVFLHSLISSLCPPPPHFESPAEGFSFSSELTAVLLAKDKLNAFGLMEPFAEDGERSVRAYGIYPMASFFNHDCLPNACRFDYVDAATGTDQHNTDIIVRMIHDVPQGREICLSYFPVNLRYSERQRRLRDDYGFTCECDRCKVEANWSDDEENLDAQENRQDAEETALMDEDCNEHMSGSETESVAQGEDDFPHAYFFLKYMCDRENCWGTLAPLPPSSDATPSSVLECNVCGNLKDCNAAM